MDENSKKTLSLLKLWMLSTYPEKHLELFVKEFEEDYDEFKELVDDFIKLVINKIDSEAIIN